MKLPLLIVVIALLVLPEMFAQTEVQLRRDDGTAAGAHATLPAGVEESVILNPAGPCKLLSIQVYMTGAQAGTDTVYLVGDPAEGAIPPTQWVWSYNVQRAWVVRYEGSAGWVNLTLPEPMQFSGYQRVIVQHRTKQGGPYFARDAQLASPVGSFIMNPFENNSLNFPGRYYAANGDFLVRATVIYDFPRSTTSMPPPTTPQFLDVSDSVGLVNAQRQLVRSDQVSVADWNRDGWPDIAIGSTLYQNLRNGKFQDISSQIRISAASTVWADFTGDGWVDCFAVQGFNNDKLWRNNRDGTFSDITESSGFSNNAPTVSPLFLDSDADGDLDLFIANGRREANGQETYFADKLWENLGDGRFRDITATSGIADGDIGGPYDCWGASLCDFDNDGFTDIFVANYRLAPDRLFQNNQDGTFTEVSELYDVQGLPTADPRYFGHGMGSDWGDYNNDGWMDLAVGNLGHPDWRGSFSNPSLIYRNDGVVFTETGQEQGLKFFEMNAGVCWLDADLDGNLDLWHSQFAYQADGVNGEPRRLSRMYMNKGRTQDWALEDRTWHLGSLIHGAWSAVRLDYDNDGDYDLCAASPTTGVRLFRNDIERKGDWIGLTVMNSDIDERSSEAFDVRLLVYSNGDTITSQQPGTILNARASQSSYEQLFGLGTTNGFVSAMVRAGDNPQQTFNNLMPNTKYIMGAGGKPTPVRGVTPALKSPRNGDVRVALSPQVTLEAWGLGNATSYAFEVYSGQAPFWVPVGKFATDRPVVVLPNTLRRDVYHWRACALYGTDSSAWTAWWTFTTVDPSSAQDNVSPSTLQLSREPAPNPMSSGFWLGVESASDDPVTVTMTDLLGRIVLTDSASPNGLIYIDRGNVANGVYTIVVEQAGKRATRQVSVVD